jgi:hypothetical protein
MAADYVNDLGVRRAAQRRDDVGGFSLACIPVLEPLIFRLVSE